MSARVAQSFACSTGWSGSLCPSSAYSSRASFWQCIQPGKACKSRRASPNVRAVSAPEECNEQECAPEKEVGKISMDWVAEEKTKISGTFPPMGKKKWTGYVEKDTAGQTNIYAVEPTVYVSESVISSGTQGDSTEGSEQTIVVSVALAFGLIIATGVVLQSVGISNTPVAPEAPYSGPSLSFYIQKFKQYATVEVAAPQLASSVETTPVQAAPEVASPVEVEFSSSQPAAAADTELSISTSDFGVQGES